MTYIGQKAWQTGYLKSNEKLLCLMDTSALVWRYVLFHNLQIKFIDFELSCLVTNEK